MSIVEDEDALTLAAAQPPRVRRRRLRAILLAVFTAQYTIVAVLVSLSVAGTLRYQVTPQIVEKFEAIATALKRLPGS
jgi:Flp pilus assembly pilin Flp